MDSKIKPKDRFGCTPKKGTKARMVLRLTMRTEGATGHEIKAVYDGRRNMHQVFNQLRNEKGWDIRRFKRQAIGQRIDEGDHSYTVYRCVGRMFWDGRYRSFVK